MIESGIRIEDLDHSFGKQKALIGVNMEIPKGKIVGLLGPSGSGKTTLIRCVVGLLRQTKGTVTVSGKKAQDPSLAREIGYMAQFDALYDDLTGLQNLEFFGTLYGYQRKSLNERIESVLALTLLKGHEGKQVKNYSGGMKKRLSLAITLLHEPSLLILDEPTIGIDPVLRAEFWAEFYRLRDSGCTIVLTTHVMDEAAKCDMLGMIFEGKLLMYASPRKIMENTGTASIEEAFLDLRKKSDIETKEALHA
jgi:ABC-2 type transport system ATP-binding protein